MFFQASSLLLCLQALTFAVPVSAAGAIELSAKDFAETTKEGLWLIEHFSPYCVHCKKFKPSWQRLAHESKTEIPEVNFGTVDCVKHGDLCDQNNVKGYPSIFMFADGKNLEEFKKARELPLIKEFMREHVKSYKASAFQRPPTDEDIEDPVVGLPTDSPPTTPGAPSKPSAPILNAYGKVLALNPSTFASTLAKGPGFVKFYAPWCGHCKKLAPIWSQVAGRLQGKVTIAEVNCDEHHNLCKDHDVQGYPTLIWYPGGETDPKEAKSEYNGGRKLEVLLDFADKAMNAGVREISSDADLKDFVAKDEVVYLLLHQERESSVISQIRQASAPLLGSPPVLSSSSQPLLHTFSISDQTPWALIAIKDHDMTLPSAIYSAKRSQSASSSTYNAAHDKEVKDWLMSHRLPTALELSQSTFQQVMNAPQKPLVVIAAVDFSTSEASDSRAKITESLQDIAKKWRIRTGGKGSASGREIVFTIMDKGKWASWLKSMYGIKGTSDGPRQDVLDGVQVVIADHSNLIYYDTDSTGRTISFTSTSTLFKAVEDAASGKTSYKNSENFVERLARSLNNHMQTLEFYVMEHPFKTAMFGLGFVVLVIWGLSKILNATAGAPEDWREMKGKNGRLD